MKTLFSILMTFIFTTSSFAQEVMQKEAVMSLGNNNAFVVSLEGADKKLTEKAWEDYLKKFGKVKRNKKADEYFCEECNISLLSSNTLQVTMKIEERKEMTMLSAWYDDGSSFVSSESNPEMAGDIEKFMADFGLEVEKKVVQNELEEEEKSLKNVQKDLEKLEKENKKLHDEIAKLKQKIIDAENDIEKNLSEQDQKKYEINEQSKVVETVTEKLNSIGKN